MFHLLEIVKFIQQSTDLQGTFSWKEWSKIFRDCFFIRFTIFISKILNRDHFQELTESHPRSFVIRKQKPFVKDFNITTGLCFVNDKLSKRSPVIEAYALY